MRLCAFTDEISLDFERALRTCADHGIEEIQVRRVNGPNAVELPDDEIDRLVRLARDYGRRVAAIGSPYGKPPADAQPAGLDEAARREHRRVFDRALRLAERFDAPMVRVFAVGAPARDASDFEARVGTSVEWLREPVERAAAVGRVVGLENEYTTLAGTCRQARRVLELVDHPALRVAWDVASGWWDREPIRDGYDLIHGRICDVHVRDAAPDPADRSRHGPVVRFGEGAIDWPGIVARLVADGYQGTMTLETHLYSTDPDRWTKLPAASIHAAGELGKLIASAAGRGARPAGSSCGAME
jgi:sugar phosphate isomerase/epimerase